ncbi:hypothetical protein ABWH96_06575 [Marivirga tractuosa]|uniref:hypothetical protein n=1 Tax=Marivirga tractuosa TaxID=1006 RepID=UPI0035D1315B
MSKFFIPFCLLLTLCSCSNTSDKHVLTADIMGHYEEVYNWNQVIGLPTFKACDDNDKHHLDYLRKSSDKDDLFYMLNDTSSVAFKVFLIQEIHKKYPEYDSLIIKKYGSDTTVIEFVSSCVGITYERTLGETSQHIVSDYQNDPLLLRNIKFQK